MVKKIVKFFLYMIFFLFSLEIFMPKQNLYFLLEKKVKDYGFVISNETIKDNYTTLDIKNLEISLKGIDSAVVDDVVVGLFGFYNFVEIKNVELSSIASSFLPLKIKEINLNYMIFNPLHAKAYATGEFGEADIDIDIKDKKVYITLKPSKLMLSRYKTTLREFKKDEDGEYRYEKSF